MKFKRVGGIVLKCSDWICCFPCFSIFSYPFLPHFSDFSSFWMHWASFCCTFQRFLGFHSTLLLLPLLLLSFLSFFSFFLSVKEEQISSFVKWNLFVPGKWFGCGASLPALPCSFHVNAFPLNIKNVNVKCFYQFFWKKMEFWRQFWRQHFQILIRGCDNISIMSNAIGGIIIIEKEWDKFWCFLHFFE